MDEKGQSERSRKEFDWFDRKSSRRLMWRGLVALSLLSVAAEFFVHRDSHFGVDGIFGFYALLGFVACVLMILIAKGLGFFLKRDENYYARWEGGAEEEEAGDE